MIYIYFTIAAILIFGGIIVYAFGMAITQMESTMITVYPAMASDLGVQFLGSIWYWMVLMILIAGLIYVVVNSRKELGGAAF